MRCIAMMASPSRATRMSVAVYVNVAATAVRQEAIAAPLRGLEIAWPVDE